VGLFRKLDRAEACHARDTAGPEHLGRRRRPFSGAIAWRRDPRPPHRTRVATDDDPPRTARARRRGRPPLPCRPAAGAGGPAASPEAARARRKARRGLVGSRQDQMASAWD